MHAHTHSPHAHACTRLVAAMYCPLPCGLALREARRSCRTNRACVPLPGCMVCKQRPARIATGPHLNRQHQRGMHACMGVRQLTNAAGLGDEPLVGVVHRQARKHVHHLPHSPKVAVGLVTAHRGGEHTQELLRMRMHMRRVALSVVGCASSERGGEHKCGHADLEWGLKVCCSVCWVTHIVMSMLSQLAEACMNENCVILTVPPYPSPPHPASTDTPQGLVAGMGAKLPCQACMPSGGPATAAGCSGPCTLRAVIERMLQPARLLGWDERQAGGAPGRTARHARTHAPAPGARPAAAGGGSPPAPPAATRP